MKYGLPMVSLVVALTACTTTKRDDVSHDGRPLPEQEALEEAYAGHSDPQLSAFVEKWKSDSAPIEPGNFDLLPEVIRSSYEIFEDFYTPLDLNRIGGSEWGNDVYGSTKCFIVQDSVSVRIDRQLPQDPLGIQSPDWHTIAEFRIENFRPRIDVGSRKVLYLRSNYEKALKSFLGNEYSPLGSGNIMNPARARGESEKRRLFLSEQFLVIEGHWGGYWQFETQPKVNEIVFDPALTEAVVYFRVFYEGGEARFRKENGNWKMTESKRTWIE